ESVAPAGEYPAAGWEARAPRSRIEQQGREAPCGPLRVHDWGDINLPLRIALRSQPLVPLGMAIGEVEGAPVAVVDGRVINPDGILEILRRISDEHNEPAEVLGKRRSALVLPVIGLLEPHNASGGMLNLSLLVEHVGKVGWYADDPRAAVEDTAARLAVIQEIHSSLSRAQ